MAIDFGNIDNIRFTWETATLSRPTCKFYKLSENLQLTIKNCHALVEKLIIFSMLFVLFNLGLFPSY